MFWGNVLVALQYYKAHCEICQVARSLGNLTENGLRLAPTVRIPDQPRKNTHTRRCKLYQTCTYLVLASPKFFVVANGNRLSAGQIENILAPSKSIAPLVQRRRKSENVFIFAFEEIGAPSFPRSFGGSRLLAVAPRPMSFAWCTGVSTEYNLLRLW